MSYDRHDRQGAWRAAVEELGGDRRRLTIASDGRPMRWQEVLRAWCDGNEFVDWFSDCLAAMPFDALRWETPPLTSAVLEQSFECVVLDAPELLRPADPTDFASYFETGRNVVRFDNLGGDAELVVPTPVAGRKGYPHLAVFLRDAPRSQQRALWRAVAEAMDVRLGDRPVWLNTAGAGVPWLHVRLDDRPKYYGHAPYRALPGSR